MGNNQGLANCQVNIAVRITRQTPILPVLVIFVMVAGDVFPYLCSPTSSKMKIG